MSKSHFIPFICMLVLSVAGLTGCNDSVQTLLDKSKKMENVSVDSMLFYLQQVKHPQTLKGQQQAEYCFSLYNATLWKTGKSQDSLLKVCIPIFYRLKDTLAWQEAKLAEAKSYYYSEQPDSILHHLASLQSSKPHMSYSQKLDFYNLQRIGYSMKAQYPKAMDAIDSLLELSKAANDTLTCFYGNQNRLNLLSHSERMNEVLPGYYQLLNSVAGSSKYRYLAYSTAEQIVNFYVEQKDFTKALEATKLLQTYRQNRDAAPYCLFIQGEIHQSLNHPDSAKYYFQAAATSTSPYIAAEATTRLFRLINVTESPEQAYYMTQRQGVMHQNLISSIHSEEATRKYNEVKLQNELYQLRLAQQEKELWMMGIAVILLLSALIILYFYQREKKKRILSEQKFREEQIKEETNRLQHENQLLHKEAELSAMREKEILMRNKESEMREALFRHIYFFQKLPSLHATSSESNPGSQKISVNDTEWAEVRQAINDGFDNFANRLQESFPELNEKDICFCCLVKTQVNIQDLSDIYCVSKAAITKRKYRIKTDKMHIIDENLSLDSFLQSF